MKAKHSWYEGYKNSKSILCKILKKAKTPNLPILDSNVLYFDKKKAI